MFPIVFTLVVLETLHLAVFISFFLFLPSTRIIGIEKTDTLATGVKAVNRITIGVDHGGRVRINLETTEGEGDSCMRKE